MRSPNHAQEQDRLAFLRRLQILDSLREEMYDDFTLLASTICRTPIAALSLVDENRQWFKSSVGLTITETSREVSFCSYAILSDEPLIVPNAQLDTRFADNDLVTGDFQLRFYAGVPITVEGLPLGSLCVMDREPREISEGQISALAALARQLSHTFEARLTKLREQEYRDLLEEAERAFEQVRRRYECLFKAGCVAQICTDPTGIIREINEMAESLFEIRDFQVIGTHITSFLPDHAWDRLNLLARSENDSLQEEIIPGCGDQDSTDLWHASKAMRNSEGELTGVLHSFRKESRSQNSGPLDLSLLRLAMTDELTGIANRRGFIAELEREFRSVGRDELSILLIDIDHFKEINDTYGHLHGDQVLATLAGILAQSSRAGDVPARFGGEEFVVILPRTSSFEAKLIAERMRKAIADHRWSKSPVTVSIGTATTSASTSTPNALLSLADVRLYEAKRSGRNRIIAA